MFNAHPHCLQGLPLQLQLQQASHILHWSARDGRGLMEIAAWGEGVNVWWVLPLSLIRSSSPAQKRMQQHWLGPWACPTCRARLRPPPAFRSYIFLGYISNKSQKDLDDLMDGPPGFFYTCVQRLLTYWFNWPNTYEIGIILVDYEDVFIADLQCAMTRP